jgi:transcription initiation factor IIF auxiliary subunit
MKCELIKSNMLNEEIFGIQFTVGNRHELVENPKQANSNKNLKNKHKWTCFIELNHPMLKKYTYKLIDKVDFQLHETFRPPLRTAKSVEGKPIEYSTIGWGTFDVPMTIHWKKEVGIA